ncbi:unnamed protein product [Linum tenue]|uniref:Uncharacterized protein n=2 Tax=Linum tenue TaxID=586396 RepID=A0AAV0MB01_9ROSI|nr:unnamed protein product [Linum tenue]
MKSLSSIGLGLSIVFGCLLLALVGELYYLLWWKRRFTNRRMTTGRDGLSSPAKELFYMFCLKKPSSSNQELCSSVRITDALVVNNEVHQAKEFVFKPFGGDHESSSDDVVEGELMMLSNNSLSGPPRFLFTIVEETREDLESEEAKSRAGGGKGSRGRSLSDLMLTVETPYLTPLASPPFFTPPLTPMVDPISSHGQLETSAEAEFNKLRSSPPPKFKFLQDAEEKLHRRRRLEEVDDKGKLQIMKRVNRNQKMAENSKLVQGEEVDGPFITIIVDKYRDREVSSGSMSQVLPLPSSPSSSKGKAPFMS